MLRIPTRPSALVGRWTRKAALPVPARRAGFRLAGLRAVATGMLLLAAAVASRPAHAQSFVPFAPNVGLGGDPTSLAVYNGETYVSGALVGGAVGAGVGAATTPRR